ncbi:MAG: hypothetical protein AB7E70_21660 [Hyphomicrobiaceae bacterium]
MTSGGILALDLATTVGWASAAPGYRAVLPISARHGVQEWAANLALMRSGSHRIAPPGAGLPEFFHAFDLWLADMITVHQPDLLIFEAPIIAGGKTSVETARKLMGLAVLTELTGYRRSIPKVREENVITVKKHWTGHGRADKRMMIDAARQRGFEPADDNAADALALADYAAAMIERKQRARVQAA